MSATSWLYVVMFFTGVFSILIFMLGFEKTLRLIFSNYVITILCITLGLLIDFESTQILANGTNILGFNSKQLANFLLDGKLTLLTISYSIFMLIQYKFSVFSIDLPIDENKKKGLMLLLVPLCVSGIVFSLLILLLGSNIFDLGWITRNIPENSGLRNIIFMMPLWIMLHGLLIIILGIKLRLGYKKTEHITVSDYNQGL